MNFQKSNNITGWVAFAVALATYWLTMEETASYWDCGEFIAVSYKLEVPHPPGAPLFLLIGRLFSFLAMGDLTKVAYWINFSSVLASAFAVLFLFWSITLFGRKIMNTKANDLSGGQIWTLMGAGLVGSLAYTFSESAWFSAAEAEVYAMSSFFTAFVVWAMLKWDAIEEESKANRWLLLLFYMMGLSIGVHLLNLVTIPALALLYYFKKYQPSTWGIILTMIISLLIIFFINDIIIPGLPSIAGSFDLFFVNSLGLPFGSGAILFALIVLSALIFGIRYTQQHKQVVYNTIMNSVAFILIGYSSYALVVIRSNDQTPINENDPSDVMSFVSYLKREQYGSRPLLYGPYFDAQPVDMTEGDNVYYKGKDKYEIQDKKFEYVYPANRQTLFPRIYSSDPSHQAAYRRLLNLRANEVPDASDNLYFLFDHQIRWMYFRYFLFNFAGRESDMQNAPGVMPWDWGKVLPAEIANNEAHNNFFCIPLILGIIGMIYQMSKDGRNFVVVGLLFILTGVALVIYLNSPPTEPRERDYIYAGSYYAFCFWIGFSVIAIADTLIKVFNSAKVAAITATLVALTAPAIMAQQGWDDHDRSDRFFSVDSAVNYLESCAPNAILFTGGDNDTFPLWYAQEVEEVRQDVRVVVLSYYNTDWYIEQSMQKHYTSEPFPYTLTTDNYRQGGRNDYLPFEDKKIGAIDLPKFLSWIRNNNPQLLHPGYGGERNMLPSKNLVLNVDTEKVKSLGIIPKGLDSLLVSQMTLQVTSNILEKKDLAMLDVLATANWERPIYVNPTSLSQFNVDLSPYAYLEGNAYRILPLKKPASLERVEMVNTEVAFENMMKKFRFRNLDRADVYYTPDYTNFVMNHRSNFNALAEFLILQDDPKRAREALLYSLNKMPDAGIPYDLYNAQMVSLLFEVGEKEKAIEVVNVMYPRADEAARYFLENQQMGRDLQIQLAILREMFSALYQYGEADLAKKIEESYNKHINFYQGGAAPGRSNF
jgi:hypothetical protein